MVRLCVAYILSRQPITVKGSPKRYRDYIYIDDVIDAYWWCLSNPKTFGRSYNVAVGKKVTLKGLIDAELTAFEHNPSSIR